jgi:hypothetical protein
MIEDPATSKMGSALVIQDFMDSIARMRNVKKIATEEEIV